MDCFSVSLLPHSVSEASSVMSQLVDTLRFQSGTCEIFETDHGIFVNFQTKSKLQIFLLFFWNLMEQGRS